MEEWDQWVVDNRSLETMRQIALDAMAFEEEDEDAFYNYAEEHDLTVNEVAYYLNAYEAGGDAGLEAIRNPDVISPDVARRAIKAIAKMLDEHFEGQVPYRLTDEGTGIGLYEIQERENGDRYLFPVCQLRLTLATRQWHLYWMRSNSRFGIVCHPSVSPRAQKTGLRIGVLASVPQNEASGFSQNGKQR